MSIPNTYKRDGYKATLVESEEIPAEGYGPPQFRAIYRRAKPNTPDHFEVVILRYRKPSKGVGFAGGYVLPSPSLWGKYGWTYTRAMDAKKKYEELA